MIDDIKKVEIMLSIGVPLILCLVLFLTLLSNQSASGDESIVIVEHDGFAVPFADKVIFHETSPFGYRYDPFGSGEIKFHSGIDLATSMGTDVLASADGVVYEVGYSATGLGNYVYIKHQTDDGILYTAYGHMMDNSIVVEKGQPIIQGQKVGQVGSTGASTGPHLHFMIMKNKISFKYEDLIDPHFVIYGVE